jgi:hypothetical protein
MQQIRQMIADATNTPLSKAFKQHVLESGAENVHRTAPMTEEQKWQEALTGRLSTPAEDVAHSFPNNNPSFQVATATIEEQNRGAHAVAKVTRKAAIPHISSKASAGSYRSTAGSISLPPAIANLIKLPRKTLNFLPLYHEDEDDTPAAKEGVAAATQASPASKLYHAAKTEDVRNISHAPASSSASSPAAAVAAKTTGAHISQLEVARRAAEASERLAQQRLNDLRQQAAVDHFEYETSLGMDKIAQQAQAEASQHRQLYYIILFYTHTHTHTHTHTQTHTQHAYCIYHIYIYIYI